MRAIGDLASFILSSRFHVDLRTHANEASKAATTGVAPDKARHLGGSTMALSLLDRKAVLLEQHQRGIAEAAVFAGATQTALGRIQHQAGDLAANLSMVSQLQLPSELATLSDDAAGTLIDVVNTLNSEIAGRHLFSGSATRTQPLPSGAELLGLVRSEVAGAATAADIETALDAYFDTPGGGFETAAYNGSDTGFMSLSLSADDTAQFGLRADDTTVKDLLKALSKAALANDPLASLSVVDQTRLLRESHSELLALDDEITAERGSLGLTEEQIENKRLRAVEEVSSLAQKRLSLIGIDQFEAATEFEAAQQQLEVFYRIAARQGRTSLAEYLR